MDKIHRRNIILTRTLFVVWAILLFLNILTHETMRNILSFVVFGLATFSVSFTLNRMKKGVRFVMYYLQTAMIGLIAVLLWNQSGVLVFVYLYMAISPPLLYQDKTFFIFSLGESLLCGTFFFFHDRKWMFPNTPPSGYAYIAFSFILLGLVIYVAIRNIDRAQQSLMEMNQESERTRIRLANTLSIVQAQTDAVRSFSNELSNHVGFASDHFRNITTSFQEMQQAFKQQNHSLVENSLDMERIALGSEGVSQGSRRINEKIKQSNSFIEQSSVQMNELEQHTQQMNQLFTETEEVTEHLHRKLRDIQGMSELIGNVAQQTNLLSLNASITAEQAGDANGRAFAVIAEEVRVLANSAEQAAATIQTQIQEISMMSDVTLSKMKASRQSVDKTITNSNLVKGSLGEIKEQSHSIVEEIRKIQGEIENLRSSLENMNMQSANLSSISEENSAQLEGLEDSFVELQASMARIEKDFQHLQSQLN